MTHDTLVFDIETQNFFTDSGVGWDNFAALRISVVGAYSYAEDKYFCFDEHEMNAAADLFRRAGRIVGFSINRYDVPVMQLHFEKLGPARVDLWTKERVDLLEEVEMVAGQRISLSKLAEANLGVGKDRHGSEAITLYNQGEMEELKKYCLKDVELTKKLYDLYRGRGYFLLPDRRSGEIVQVNFGNRNANAARLF